MNSATGSIADELVHDPVALVDDLRRGAVEAGEQAGKLVGRHVLG
jgi:hypothetical protein